MAYGPQVSSFLQVARERLAITAVEADYYQMQRARRAVEAKLQWSSATADRLAAERVERARMLSPAQTHNLLIEELLLDAHHPDLTMHDQETALFEDAIAEQRDEDDDLDLLTDQLGGDCWNVSGTTGFSPVECETLRAMAADISLLVAAQAVDSSDLRAQAQGGAVPVVTVTLPASSATYATTTNVESGAGPARAPTTATGVHLHSRPGRGGGGGGGG